MGKDTLLVGACIENGARPHQPCKSGSVLSSGATVLQFVGSERRLGIEDSKFQTQVVVVIVTSILSRVVSMVGWPIRSLA